MTLQVRSSRSASMRKPKEPEANRSRILSAATAEFAARGYKGASMDAIAARTSTTRALINYYFGSKDELFLAVLENVYADIRDAEQALHLRDMGPADAIRRLTEFTWTYYLEHPEFITLLNSANLHQARHLSQSKRVREMNSPLIQTLGDILEKGRRDGVLRGGIDPLQLYISIAALAYFYLSNSHTLTAIFGRDLMSRKARAERLSHMCDVILGHVLRD